MASLMNNSRPICGVGQPAARQDQHLGLPRGQRLAGGGRSGGAARSRVTSRPATEGASTVSPRAAAKIAPTRAARGVSLSR